MYAKLPYQTLPPSGQLLNGTWVSNYNLLPDSVLIAEGWLPLEEIRPSLTDGQYYKLNSAVEQNGKIIATYVVVDVPPPSVDPEAELVIQELEVLI